MKENLKDMTKKIEGSIKSADSSIKKLKGKNFVFTHAQNNTKVHDKFLQSLLVYCEYNNAQLIVGKSIYNKSAHYKLDDERITYDQKITEFMLDDDYIVADSLIWCGSLNILPTATNPLNGLESYVMNRSGIVPHAKMQLKSLPTHISEECRMLYSTGSVTMRNYIKRKAGQKADFHHVYGALIVEVEQDGTWHARQINADDRTGEFYDLDRYYAPEGVYKNDKVLAINWGDIHSENINKDYEKKAWIDKNSMIDQLRPDYQFAHDVHDHYRRNHHNIKDIYHNYKMHCRGTESVKQEIKTTTDTLERMHRPFCKTVVVHSNHDAALKKWLSEADYRLDNANAEYFLKLQLETYKSIRENKFFDVFKYACILENEKMKRVRFLKQDESFKLKNIEFGQHGHNGNNGARGSIKSFRVLGVKTNTGHTHSAEIIDGCYVAGAMITAEDADYTKGGSSWSVSHIITYQNGKRAIITMKKNKKGVVKWRA